jgi:alpha-tubulin suppressor-like RCC1 family protein
VSGISNAVAIATGANTCALLATGEVDCWSFDRLREVPVAGISDATAISASEGDTCALLATGVVECWGGDEHGELGDGRFEDVGGPVVVAGITNATAVSVGWGTCALLSTGEMDCWGDNRYGQLGNGTNSGPESCWGPGQREAVACSSVPVRVRHLHHAIAIAAGAGQTCAILRTGEVDCWGRNYRRSLGDGATSSPETCEGERRFEPDEPPRRPTFPCSRFPVPVRHLAHATVIAAGLNGTCAILATRSVDCWGTLGYLGRDDTKKKSDVPVPLDGFE